MMTTCSIKGCDLRRHARGWCQVHYARWYRHGDASAVVSQRDMHPPATCTVSGCDRPYQARGYCDAHYQRYARYGTPRADVPIAPLGWNTRPARDVPMPCPVESIDRIMAARLATATEQRANQHLAAWWAMDARIQAANDADDARLAAD